jgi:hypothetical protein
MFSHTAAMEKRKPPRKQQNAATHNPPTCQVEACSTKLKASSNSHPDIPKKEIVEIISPKVRVLLNFRLETRLDIKTPGR